MSNAVYPSAVRGLLKYSVTKTPEFGTLEQKSSNGYTLRIPQMNNPIWHFILTYDYVYDTYYSPNNIQAFAPYTDLQALLGFFLARRGKSDDFLLIDPNDQWASGRRSNVWRTNWAYPAGTAIIDSLGNAQVTALGGTTGAVPPIFSQALGGVTSEGAISWVNSGNYPDGWPNAQAPLTLVTDAAGNYYSPLQRDVGGVFSEDVTDIVPGSLAVYSGGALTTSYTVKGPGLAVPGASYMGLYLAWGAVPAQPITANFQFYYRVRFEEDTQDFESWANGLWTIGGSNARNSSALKLVSSRTTRV